MVKLGIRVHSVGSCMVGQPAIKSQWCIVGENAPQIKAKGKLHQMEFLGGESSACIIGGRSGAAGWAGSCRHKDLALLKV